MKVEVFDDDIRITYGVIYVFQNRINGKCYVGQTVEPEKRYRTHINNAKNGVDHPLYRAIRKYGIDNFHYFLVFASHLPVEFVNKVLDEQEIKWIKFFDSYKNGYNQTPGGCGTAGCIPWNKGVPRTELEREHMSEGQKRYFSTHTHPMKGKKYPEETRKRMGLPKGHIASNKGVKYSEETRKRMGAPIKGKHRVYREDGTWYFA